MKYKYKIASLALAIFMFFMPVSLATSQNKIVGLDENVKALSLIHILWNKGSL